MSKSAVFLRWIFYNVIFVCVMFNDVNCFNQTTGDEQDYCNLEYFRPSCPLGEVIIMKSAKYGRMQMGRCVKGDIGHIGCSNDVVPEVDRRCSGWQSCEILVTAETFQKNDGCLIELTDTYFLASFECAKVETASSQQCVSTTYIVPSSPISGIISSDVTKKTDKGSSTCPWLIAVNPGQKVNITLYDFATEDNMDDICRVYAVIKERTDSGISSMTVCGGTDREKIVYVSEGHSLEITILENRVNFLLKYEVSERYWPPLQSGVPGKVNNWINLLSGVVIGITVLLH